MTDTPHLALPLLAAAQSQKHVTHNQALVVLDAIVQLSVISSTLTAPPGAPAEGDRYKVASGATGAWAGWDLNLALFTDGQWTKLVPNKGWICFDASTGALGVWTGVTWVDFGTAGGYLTLAGAGNGTLTKAGILTAADNSNRLAVKSNAVLFSHDDVTPGTGDIRATFNKSTAGKDAGFVLQTGWSTRAMLGLLGTDDVALKLSPDASSYYAGFRGWKDLHGRLDMKEARRRHPVTWSPRPGTTTIDQVGLTATITGTATAVAPSAGNLFLSSPRLGFASAAAAGSSAGANGNALFLWRGNGASLGGFYLLLRFGIETFQATCRLFAGLAGTTAAIGNVNPSTLLNMVGVGFDSGQTTLRLFSNDGSGAATAVDLGAGFPTTGSQNLYELILSAEPNGADVKYRVERLNAGDVAAGTIAADLPVATQFLTPHLWFNSGTTAGAVNVALFQMYAEPAALLGSRGVL